jgi:hypothetical protein
MQGFYSEADCRIDEFQALISEQLVKADVPFADRIECNIPVYEDNTIDRALGDPDTRVLLMAEWANVLGHLSGAVALKGAIRDLEALDLATAIFEKIIEEERAQSSGGDHFGERGANDRIWNSLQKLCLRDPAVFARYFASPAIAAVSQAWLGPWWQMTTQANLVRPGGRRRFATGTITLVS